MMFEYVFLWYDKNITSLNITSHKHVQITKHKFEFVLLHVQFDEYWNVYFVIVVPWFSIKKKKEWFGQITWCVSRMCAFVLVLSNLFNVHRIYQGSELLLFISAYDPASCTTTWTTSYIILEIFRVLEVVTWSYWKYNEMYCCVSVKNVLFHKPFFLAQNWSSVSLCFKKTVVRSFLKIPQASV